MAKEAFDRDVGGVKMKSGSMKKAGTYGEQVAARFKNQYFDRRSKTWDVFSFWQIQPEDIYLILTELKSKEAIHILIGDTWIRRLRKPGSAIKRRNK